MGLISGAGPPFYVQRVMPELNAPDLTKRAPRSPRVRLGGFAILPRMLDKGRATVAGTHGEFHFNCPLDERFVEFAGIDPSALKDQLAAGKSDAEILTWVQENSTNKPNPVEIAAWSAYQDQRVPADLESRQFFNDYHAKLAPHREDVTTWFDILDIDDFVTFGGKP
jgi:hypothetical protein